MGSQGTYLKWCYLSCVPDNLYLLPKVVRMGTTSRNIRANLATFWSGYALTSKGPGTWNLEGNH